MPFIAIDFYRSFIHKKCSFWYLFPLYFTIDDIKYPLKEIDEIEEYQDKTWATRKRPFVDRFASAWLIKKFIDENASFVFIDEKNLDNMDKDVIPFDIRGGRFTHAGEKNIAF